jgi:transposase
MAATRLTDSQKSELVARYRDGAASQELAEAYGCSINTVTRVVKATLTPSDYEQLKQQRAKGGSKLPQAKEAAPKAALPEEVEEPELRLEPQQPVVVEAEIQRELAAEPDLALEAPVVLAIADADDFADDSDDDDCDGVDAEGDDADGDSDDFVEQFVAVPIALVGHSFQPVLCQPLGDAALPASVYMLVDKTVELQAKPLTDFPELGQLPAEEEGRQALMVFANPRQAKRHCGRTQRVIKVPDTRILERTAPYLVAQGITRVVMEGSLYSLPGS